MHGRMSNGAAQLYFMRITAIVVGINWSDAVLITMNVAIESVATPFFCECFAISFIAHSPNGVAAFPSPKKFAAIFIQTARIPASFGERSGKRRFVTGESRAARAFVMPHASAIFISPFHRHMLPSRVIKSVTAFAAPLSDACETSLTCPVKIP